MLMVSAHYLGAIVEKCAALGIDRSELIAVLPDGPDTFSDGMRRYPAAHLTDVFNKAKAISGYDNLALRVGEQLSVSSMNEAGKLLPLCATLADAAKMLSRHHRLTQTFGYTVIDMQADVPSITWRPHYSEAAPYDDIVPAIFTGFVSAGRWLSYDTAPLPLTLEFRRRTPMDTADYCQKFGCTIRFGMAHDRLLFPAAFLEHTLASSDPQSFDVMSRRLDRLLYEIDDAHAAESRAAASVREQMRNGAPTLEQTALDLRTPPRRLRAALKQAGTGFRKIVDAERMDACVRYMARGLKKSEIAYRLGFHDQPAFNRTYRRWYGVSPP